MIRGADANNLALSVHKSVSGAVERLVRGYQDQLFSFALRLLRNPMDAEEVTQDAFVRAVKALTVQYDAERCRSLIVRPWLFRITRNLAYNRSRARRLIPEEQLQIDSNGHQAAIRRAGNSRPEPRLVGEIDALDQALGCISPESRELVLLRFMEEMSYADIAATVGTSEASARAKVFRALGKLRNILSRTENKDAL